MSAAAPPRVHLERFAVGSDAIDANRHVNNKEYLHWMEAIAIAHSAACGWPLERYVAESKRLLAVLETRLEARPWVMDEYSIADISMLGWVRNLIGFYGAREIVEYDTLTDVPAWLERCLARPAVQRGLEIPPRP